MAARDQPHLLREQAHSRENERHAMLKRDLVIGLDCSTTASKAVAWDSQGNAVAEGRGPLPIVTMWAPRPATRKASASQSGGSSDRRQQRYSRPRGNLL